MLLAELNRPVSGALALHSIFLRVSVLVVVGRARRVLLCQLRDPPLCHRSPAVQTLRNERRSGWLSSNLSPAELFQPAVLSGAVDGGQLLFLFTGAIRRPERHNGFEIPLVSTAT